MGVFPPSQFFEWITLNTHVPVFPPLPGSLVPSWRQLCQIMCVRNGEQGVWGQLVSGVATEEWNIICASGFLLIHDSQDSWHVLLRKEETWEPQNRRVRHQDANRLLSNPTWWEGRRDAGRCRQTEMSQWWARGLTAYHLDGCASIESVCLTRKPVMHWVVFSI